jgi:hypothetical protein
MRVRDSIYDDPTIYVKVQKLKIVAIVVIGLIAWAAHGFPGVSI